MTYWSIDHELWIAGRELIYYVSCIDVFFFFEKLSAIISFQFFFLVNVTVIICYGSFRVRDAFT